MTSVHNAAHTIAAVLCASAATSLAQTPAVDRPWQLQLRGSVSHDTNVPLAATESTFQDERSSTVLGFAAQGEYRLYRGGPWSFGLTGTAQQTYNADSRLREFDVTTLAPGVYARRNLRIARRPALLRLGYGARRDWLGGSGYAAAHSASADLGVRPAYATEIGAFVGWSASDFRDDGALPELTSRDASAYRFGVRATQAFHGNRRAVQGAFGYVKNDADGANFVFRGPSVNVNFVSQVYGPWAFSAGVSHMHVEYPNFAVEPRRETRATDYRFVLFGPLTRKLGADLSLTRSRQNSSQAAFEARRTSVSLGITYAF